MPSPELEKYKRQAPQLADKLSQLENYLAEVLERSVPTAVDLNHAAYDIVPVLVAKDLEIDEGLALVLLRYAEEAGIIDHRYDVYCPTTDSFIERFNSKRDLPDSIPCPFEARTEHSIHDYFVELVFTFTPGFALTPKMAMSM